MVHQPGILGAGGYGDAAREQCHLVALVVAVDEQVSAVAILGRGIVEVVVVDEHHAARAVVAPDERHQPAGPRLGRRQLIRRAHCHQPGGPALAIAGRASRKHRVLHKPLRGIGPHRLQHTGGRGKPLLDHHLLLALEAHHGIGDGALGKGLAVYIGGRGGPRHAYAAVVVAAGHLERGQGRWHVKAHIGRGGRRHATARCVETSHGVGVAAV